MKTLVAYMTKTGNTKKVAESMFAGIGGEKEIKPLDAVASLAGYDIAFLGFPVISQGPDKKAVQMMEKHCVAGRNVVLFATHSAPEEAPELPEVLGKFKQAAGKANIVDVFSCQGELAKSVKFIMSVMPNANYRRWAKEDCSQGQPDQARLDRARAFAADVMQRFHGTEKKLRAAAVV